MGVHTFRAPDDYSQVTANDVTLPSRLGGGLYVQLTGLHANGYVQVRTLQGIQVWVREVEPVSHNPSVCSPQGSIMRVCRKDDAPQEVPVEADFRVPDAAPVALVKRGTRIHLWGYFEDRGRWSLVETRGKVGFVRSDELCHANSKPPQVQATEHFRMITAPAKEDCYQFGRERAAAEIRRIVIHNSETTLQGTVAQFRECTPEHPVSAHVAIDRDGTMYRLVEDKFAAFHTGGTENSGGFNSISLGIEMIAAEQAELRGMTPQQERALLALIRFWSHQYHIAMPRDVLRNSALARGYNDVEYWRAPVTIHRLASAERRTDCPKFIWADSAAGDDEFFLWRRKHLGPLHNG